MRLRAATIDELAVSEAKQRAFAAKMELLLNERDRLATEAVHRAWDLLEELRASVSVELTSTSGFDAFQLPRLKAALDQLGKDFAAKYEAELSDRLDAVWALGQDSIDKGLKAADLPSLGTFQLDTTQLAIAQGITADLITRMSSEMIAAISLEIQRGMLGGQSIFETMQAVTDLLGSADAVGAKGTINFVADGIAARAETITRTEMLRAYNMANYGRAQDAVSGGVEYQMWRTARDGRVRASHKALDGKIVKVGEEFAPGLRFPLDPRADASQSINCRCRAVPAFASK